MAKNSVPSICTSSLCTSYGCSYCSKCSHGEFSGRGKVDGRVYRWMFNPRFGPLFARSKDGECDWVPGPRHKVWAVFQEWHDRKFK